jgi:hypothetical protein
MKYVAMPALVAAFVLASGLSLWLASGWLTLPLGEEGA